MEQRKGFNRRANILIFCLRYDVNRHVILTLQGVVFVWVSGKYTVLIIAL